MHFSIAFIHSQLLLNLTLELLREDDRKINAELDKIAANKNYKSSFVARSLELLKEHSEKAVQKQKAGDIEKNESFER